MPTPAEPVVVLPPGRWAIGVSGGADSTALARLVAARWRDHAVLVHLDHHLRGDDSEADAAFVVDLGRQLGVPVDVARRDAVERTIARLPSNPQAAYRTARLAWFARVVRQRSLDGVLLAHHADDQAESALLRLLRGGGVAVLGGMRVQQRLSVAESPTRLRVIRPLLGVRRDALRIYLRSIGQPWREDASNDSPAYRRNVVRRLLADRPELTRMLLDLVHASTRLRRTLAAAAPVLGQAFAADTLRVAPPLAAFAARRWLVARGAPPDRVSTAVCCRLIEQATDVMQPARQHFPGGLLVCRWHKRVDVVPSPPVQSPQAHGQETAHPPEL